MGLKQMEVNHALEARPGFAPEHNEGEGPSGALSRGGTGAISPDADDASNDGGSPDVNGAGDDAGSDPTGLTGQHIVVHWPAYGNCSGAVTAWRARPRGGHAHHVLCTTIRSASGTSATLTAGTTSAMVLSNGGQREMPRSCSRTLQAPQPPPPGLLNPRCRSARSLALLPGPTPSSTP